MATVTRKFETPATRRRLFGGKFKTDLRQNESEKVFGEPRPPDDVQAFELSVHHGHAALGHLQQVEQRFGRFGLFVVGL